MRLMKIIKNFFLYAVLIIFAFLMIFPFLYMLSTSLKLPTDTFSYPPRLIPYDPVTVSVEGYDEPLQLYNVEIDGEEKERALAESNIRIGTFVDPANPEMEYERQLSEVSPTGGYTNPETIQYNGEEQKLFDVEVDGRTIPMVQIDQTVLGRFVDPQNPEDEVLRNVRLSAPVEKPSIHFENFQEVIELKGMERSLTNTVLVTFLVVAGQIITSIMGGYAFARLRFPGRDKLFVLYLGTIMIPFVVLIIPLYQLMVLLKWTDTLTSLVVPWVFTAYGTFMMRQAFITFPREIEEAAVIDGASRMQILIRLLIPSSTPAIATQATFTFLYAWNSFLWPLIIINTGNYENHVLTLTLSQLRGQAMNTPNLIMAGATIAIIVPIIVFLMVQRYYIESFTSTGVKG